MITENKEDPLASEIRELAAGIQEIKNEQEYTIAREKSHRNSKSLMPLHSNTTFLQRGADLDAIFDFF